MKMKSKQVRKHHGDLRRIVDGAMRTLRKYRDRSMSDQKEKGYVSLSSLSGDSIPDEIKFSRESVRGMMGAGLDGKSYVIDIGAWSAFGTTSASLLRFTTLGTSAGYGWIPMSAGVSGSTYSSDLSNIALLFDEYKTESMTIHYEPTNPYNRGSTTNSDPIAFFYDDENVTDVGVTSDTSGIGNRGSNLKLFSLDHSFHHTFSRPSPLSEYAWAAEAPSTLVNVNGWSGVVCLAYNATSLTASTRYGIVTISFRMHCRFRI